MRIKIFGAGMTLLAATMGCGTDSVINNGNGTIATLPTCQAGQLLTTDSSGNPACVSYNILSFTLPKCNPTTEALTSNGKGVSCTQRLSCGAL